MKQEKRGWNPTDGTYTWTRGSSLRQLSIAIFGNTNNYPLSLAEGLISLGHSVRLILNRKELLHRPEARHPEWAASYPDWIVDYSDITDEDIACEMPVIEHLLQHLTNEVDLVILNDVGPALAGYLQSPSLFLFLFSHNRSTRVR